MLEETLESPLDWKEIQPVHPKGNHSRIFTGDGQGGLACFSPWGLKELSRTWLSNWTELTDNNKIIVIKKRISYWCWRRLLRIPWTERRSNQSILKEISPEYSLKGLMLKLKLPILWPPEWRSTDSFEKTLMLGKTEGRRRRGWQDEMVGWHHQLNGHEFE